MALSRVKTWISGETLTASDLNAEFTNLVNYLNNGTFWAASPSFAAYLSTSTASNVTGDGTDYAVVCDTEEWDTLGNFAAGVFTAPVAGKYLFCWQCTVENLGAGHIAGYISLVTSDARIFVGSNLNPYAIREQVSGSNIATLALAVTISLTAGQTVTPKVKINNSTKTIAVHSSSGRDARFSGHLIAG